MTDYDWPDDLVPYAVDFYLQPHTGGSESPFSRVTKVYELSAPRFVCSMSFRGGYWGDRGLEAIGPKLNAFVAKLSGRANRVALYDFRYPAMRSPLWPITAGNSAALLGDTTMTITGLMPGTKVCAGDYLGGDGRPHIITDDVFADSSGEADVSFLPPLAADVGLDAATFSKVTAPFRLTNDDAGQNPTQVGEGVNVTLDFVEDL